MEGWITNLSGIFDGYQFHVGPLHVLIENGKISQITDKPPSTSVIDGHHQFLSPPLVDGHTHLIFGGTRFNELSLKLQGMSYNDILAQGGGIQSTVQSTRAASDEDLFDLVMSRLDVMLTHGVLSVEAKSGYGLAVDEEIRLLEILNKVNEEHIVDVIPTFGAAHVFPDDMGHDQYISAIIDEMLPEVINRRLATSIDVFCDRGAFTVDETITIFDAAKIRNFPMRVHADELEYTGIGKLAAQRYDLLSADHLLQATQGDFEVLASNNTVAMFMPLAPFGLFTDDKPSGFHETDVTIGLGSDFNPNNWAISLQSAIRMAVYSYRMTPLNALAAATSGSYQGVTGTSLDPLSEGSDASVVLFNATDPATLASKFGQNMVGYVIKNGNIVVENTHLTV